MTLLNFFEYHFDKKIRGHARNSKKEPFFKLVTYYNYHGTSLRVHAWWVRVPQYP